MLPYLLGFVAVAAAFILHVIIWQFYVPHSATSVLLFLFLLVGMLLGAAYVVNVPAAGFTPADIIAYSLMVAAGAIAYPCLYSAVEVDSPSLAIVKLISAAGNRGIDFRKLESEFLKLGFVGSRVTHLVEDNLVTIQGDRLYLKKAGYWALLLLSAFTIATGRTKRGG